MKSGIFHVLNRKQAIVSLIAVFTASLLLVLFVTFIPYAYIAIATATGPAKLPINCTDRSDSVISITFDASKGDETAEDLSLVLKKHKIKATFFVTGEWAERCPGSVKLFFDSGQEIMNASNDSYGLTHMPANKVIAQINAGGDKIQAVTGVRPTLFRSSDGAYDDALLHTVKTLELYPIGWDVDSFDTLGISVDALTKRVLSQVSSGSIIRFHVDGDHTLESLPVIIENLKEKGYTFVPVSEMIHTGKFTINQQGRQIRLER